METVEGICNQLARSKLLAPEAVRSLHKRWYTEAPDSADDPARFSKWLVASGFLTDFQVGVLQRGFADLLFLDDYKLLERIGQGRMAGVYKAVHKLGQVVAVKVLPPSKARQPQMLARFQREARLSVRLKHPNVVRTYQVGKTKGDLHYLVMEYLDGETLEDVLQRRGKLPLVEALYVVSEAFLGLEHLDTEGMIHRDLKPGNLMLVPPPQETVLKSAVKILDIGLGRALFDEGGAGDDTSDLTTEGAILGTPLYMAPEQARSAHTADIRADIYSLGCVLYHCLTGQPPFSDSSVVRVIVRQATEAPKPLREFLPEVPAGLQEVMDRLLAKDPAQRPATPSAAMQALEKLKQMKQAVAAEEADVKMRSYLTWLEKAPAIVEEEEAPAPLAIPLQAPATVPARQPTLVAKPFAPPPAPAPVKTEIARGFDAELFRNLDKPAPAKPPTRRRSIFWPTWRDLLAAAAGAAVVVAVEAVLGLIWWLFF
jgi:serine/threonine protein kinase